MTILNDGPIDEVSAVSSETTLLVDSVWHCRELEEDHLCDAERSLRLFTPSHRWMHWHWPKVIKAGATVVLASVAAIAARNTWTSGPVRMLPAEELIPLNLADEKAMRKAQGLCLQLPGIRLAARDSSSIRSMKVDSADDCIEHCRTTVGCKQAVFDEDMCHLYDETLGTADRLEKGSRSALCGVLTDMTDITARKRALLHHIQVRKTTGVCVEVPDVKLADPETMTLSPKTFPDGEVDDCFEECRQLPGCNQVSFSTDSKKCVFSETRSKDAVMVGHSHRSAFCSAAGDVDKLKERRDDVQDALRMRKAQSICLDMVGVRLTPGPDCELIDNATNWAHCAERCRIMPRCAQAVFSDDTGKCYHASNITQEVDKVGDQHVSSYCGPLKKTMDMKLVQESVMKSVEDRRSHGFCKKIAGMALGGEELVRLPLDSVKPCLEHCRILPACQQVVFISEDSGNSCHLFKEATATVTHVSSAYTSAYCGGAKDHDRLEELEAKAKRSLQTRQAMGICKEVSGVQLADGGSGSVLARLGDDEATSKNCIEHCRRAPGCAQVVFSEGNQGCYLFQKAADRATHENAIYHSALCGEIKDNDKLTAAKQKVLQQVQMRKATGICKELPGIQIADGSGYHQAIFSNDTNSPHKCIEACRVQLGCEQAVYSSGNEGCYMFENASNVKAVAEGDIFHSAYCSDLKDVGVPSARKKQVKDLMEDRKKHGLCFEVPGVRAADGKGGKLVKFNKVNATRELCVKKCRDSFGCEQAVFSVKPPSCYIFTEAKEDIFPRMWADAAFHSAYCGSTTNWKVHKQQQMKVQGAADDRKKSGACVDLPGVKLVEPKGANFFTWAGNSSECVEHCRAKALCGQALYITSKKSCHLFQNYTVDFSDTGEDYHSARCSAWKDFASVKKLQNQTVALLNAKKKL